MKRLTLLFLAVAVAGLAVGCEKKFTMKRFDNMVLPGQSKMEVKKILGKPETEHPAVYGSSCMWMDKDSGATGKVIFDKKGNVLGKCWQDMKRQDPDPEPQYLDADWPTKGSKAPAGTTGSTSTSTTTVVVP
ncbi:MAG: hypothetical protein K8S55_08790 [Phycisphaerae bacterium]|nr:hypothetical protein [Phycisphaerae bacterium]